MKDQVGIGNSDERIRDYTFPADEYNTGSGHADTYYKFLRDELIPHVDANYSTDTTSRIIAGHSLGGFFVLYALFQNEIQSPLFSGFIAASPSIFWVDGYLFGLEHEVSEITHEFPVSLFMSAGNDEGVVTNVLAMEMDSRLASRNYTGFKTEYENFKGKSHEAASIPGFINGLQFVLNNE